MRTALLLIGLVVALLLAGHVETTGMGNNVSSQRAEFKNGLNTITPTKDIGLQHAVK